MRESKVSEPQAVRGNAFDRATATALGRFSERISRRGLFTKLGKVALVALGVTVLEALPADRQVALAANCGDWRLCGICGRTCDCCNGGQDLNVCPPGAAGYNYWAACCPVGGGYPDYYYIEYWDCCGTTSQCTDCTRCNNSCPRDTWCSSPNTIYWCTQVAVGVSC